MTGHTLKFLGETKLALGPAEHQQGHPWRAARDDNNTEWLILDCEGKSANTIDEAVLTGLADHLDRLSDDPPASVVLRSAKPGGFAAGADIGAFADMEESAADLLRKGHDVLDRLEALDCPTICVVHGATLGAGFEIALACDWRIAVDGASFGFPEVQLGLHPGLGGTFRLPALIDPVEAMTLMLTGKTAHTAKAKKLGIADDVVPERHVQNAVQAATEGQFEREDRGLKANAFRLETARSLAARRMRSETQKKAPKEHFPAPYALIDLWEEHGDDRTAMQAAKIQSFANLLKTDTCRNLRRVFFLRQTLKDKAGDDDGIRHVHVIGAGAMGAGIAAWSALKGKSVTLEDVKLDPLGDAVKQAQAMCEDQHLSGIETRDALDRMMPDPKGYGREHADLIVEAVPEETDLKKTIYKSLKGLKKDAILATNTSSLMLTGLAQHVSAKTRFAGLHFFNPVDKMMVVEVVRHDKTADKAVERLTAFCNAIGKLPVVVGDYPGFLVNRALTPYLLEAMVLMDEGVPKEVIDTAALRFGMPMGPVTLADQVGLDIGLHVARSLHDTLEKPMADISPRLVEMVEAGKTGKKAGEGFYDWSDGTPHPDANMDKAPADLTDRLILPMLDACVECLRKNIVASEDEIDAAMIFATGFAPFRGGPLRYARQRGIDDVTQTLRRLADTHGARFAPDDGWSRLG